MEENFLFYFLCICNCLWLKKNQKHLITTFTGLNNEEYQAVIGNDTTRYIIDDLEPACNYTFYVVAYMPMGASRMSDHVFQHTLEDGEAQCQIKGIFATVNTKPKESQFQQMK